MKACEDVIIMLSFSPNLRLAVLLEAMLVKSVYTSFYHFIIFFIIPTEDVKDLLVPFSH